MRNTLMLVLILVLNFNLLSKEEETEKSKINSSLVSGLKFRAIGPAIASGRVIDLAVNPNNFDEFYVAVASGGVFKTTNKGTTFQPIFDNYGSYSIGCVTIDPNNSHVVWVGSGENNSQRSVSYGDGVYKSIDGGKSFKNVGLKKSEHIGKIIVDPRNSDVVYVAAQGPLWNSGGDRGLYKTTDGGATWELSLEISENTGVSDIVMDPRDPDVLYASSYQRRRHVWTLINGGPEGAVYKSTNGGKSWDKLTKGLPSGYVGRIGLAISPADPDYVYAILEAEGKKGGFFRSTDRGASWSKMKTLVSSSPQYYQELFPHPKDKNTVYSVSTYSNYTTDGGKNWTNIPIKEKHVDDHVIWINPNNPEHMMIGCDGGLYETFDHCKTWRFFENLPITQFYRVSVDNAEPFYNVYGGTQDNNTIGGPTRTQSAHGLTNQDFYFTVGGDGFETVIDPKDPNIVYSQPQYGWLVRYDKKSGEMTGIQPHPEEGEELIWNWNSPVIISPHDNKTLYFAANKLFKTTNRGNSWTKISDDMTRGIDRNQLPVMDKIWDPEAVAKNASTSIYGNIVSLDESPVKKGLLYIGTDDGLIHVSEDDGANWRKISTFPSVPETTYVADIQADLFDENIVYATFDNRKKGDFKPYVLMSMDKGATWKSISSDLPENLPVHTIIQDHVKKELMFIGTEFGVYFTINSGKNWVKISSGLPTICVKDLDIQRRENDLALATFGRGFYILDDYSPLRHLTDDILDKEAHIFEIEDALMYLEDRSFGRRSLGETFWRADNHEFGAVFTYHIKDSYETLKQKRKKAEKEAQKDGGSITYPTWDELRAEDYENSPEVIFTIKDSDGNVVRRLTAPQSKGMHRITWDLRYSDVSSVNEKSNVNKNAAFPVLPGKYSVSMSIHKDGQIKEVAGPVEFNCKPLNNRTLPTTNAANVLAFQKDAFKVAKDLNGMNNYLGEAKKLWSYYKTAYLHTGEANSEILKKLYDVELMVNEVDIKLNGDKTKSKRNTRQTPSMNGRLGDILYSFWFSTSDITETAKNSLSVIKNQFGGVYNELQQIDTMLKEIKSDIEGAGGPWTPGSLPDMK